MLGKILDVWVIQVTSRDPEPDERCRREQTGGVFTVQIAGTVDARALVTGKVIVRFYPVSGDPTIEKGWRMVPLST